MSFAALSTDPDKDDRITPDAIFTALDAEHHFTIDVAASHRNTRCHRYYDVVSNGLEHSWAGEIVWCNPPFSEIEPWIEKAFAEVATGCRKVVMLLPANRTEQPWWQRWIEPVRDRGLGVRTQNLARRPRFGTPANPEGKWNSSCRFGVVVVVIEPCPRCCRG